jgi:hypothetical protein
MAAGTGILLVGRLIESADRLVGAKPAARDVCIQHLMPDKAATSFSTERFKPAYRYECPRTSMAACLEELTLDHGTVCRARCIDLTSN